MEEEQEEEKVEEKEKVEDKKEKADEIEKVQEEPKEEVSTPAKKPVGPAHPHDHPASAHPAAYPYPGWWGNVARFGGFCVGNVGQDLSRLVYLYVHCRNRIKWSETPIKLFFFFFFFKDVCCRCIFYPIVDRHCLTVPGATSPFLTPGRPGHPQVGIGLLANIKHMLRLIVKGSR